MIFAATLTFIIANDKMLCYMLYSTCNSPLVLLLAMQMSLLLLDAISKIFTIQTQEIIVHNHIPSST